MLNAYIATLFFLFTPHTQVLSIGQVDNVLDVSVFIRAKAYIVEPDKSVRRGIIGCSGTYIHEDVILTAAHCFEMPTTDIWVKGVDGVSYRAVLEKMDADKDLALLYLPNQLGKGHAYATLAPSTRVGEQVIAVGSPLKLKFLVSEGIVAQLAQEFQPYTGKYILTTAMINAGSSGGGAFNSKGELIGVNTLSIGGMFGWAGISAAVDIDTIRGFIQ